MKTQITYDSPGRDSREDSNQGDENGQKTRSQLKAPINSQGGLFLGVDCPANELHEALVLVDQRVQAVPLALTRPPRILKAADVFGKETCPTRM